MSSPLLRGIRRLAVNLFSVSGLMGSRHSFFARSAIVSHSSVEAFPYDLEQIICRQPSASISVGPPDPWIYLAVLYTVLPLIPS